MNEPMNLMTPVFNSPFTLNRYSRPIFTSLFRPEIVVETGLVTLVWATPSSSGLAYKRQFLLVLNNGGINNNNDIMRINNSTTDYIGIVSVAAVRRLFS